jgi:hypothetical protein
MAGDMVVAVGQVTSSGHTLFGHNSHRRRGEPQHLVRVPGRQHAPGESLQVQYVELPQVRQTYTVLGNQPAGCWGFAHGVNEHQLAIGCAAWHSRAACSEPRLTGPDLTRLGLERSRTASQALELLTDLIARHGQGGQSAPAAEIDSLFLVADPTRAFALEAAGDGWVVQEILHSRAMSDMAVVRQDWNRIAPGLAQRVFDQGWSEEDGNKLDFVGALCVEPTGTASALRRWGRATFLLEEQTGQVSSAFLRRLLADHYDGTRFEVDPQRGTPGPLSLCQHGGTNVVRATAASLIAELNGSLQVWCSFGPPCFCVYFPVWLEGELPLAFSSERPMSLWQLQQQLLETAKIGFHRWPMLRDRLGQLQARFDQETAEFNGEAASLRAAERTQELQRLAGILMQSQVEHFEDLVQELKGDDRTALAKTAMKG